MIWLVCIHFTESRKWDTDFRENTYLWSLLLTKSMFGIKIRILEAVSWWLLNIKKHFPKKSMVILSNQHLNNVHILVKNIFQSSQWQNYTWIINLFKVQYKHWFQYNKVRQVHWCAFIFDLSSFNLNQDEYTQWYQRATW